MINQFKDLSIFKDIPLFKDVILKPDFSKIVEGFWQSAMLAGAYSAYNPAVMYYAGVMGAINSMYDVKEK